MNYTPASQIRMNAQPAANTFRDDMMIPALPKNPAVAMAYVPFQTDTATYDEVKALACGTLFPCLNKPFKGSGTR